MNVIKNAWEDQSSSDVPVLVFCLYKCCTTNCDTFVHSIAGLCG